MYWKFRFFVICLQSSRFFPAQKSFCHVLQLLDEENTSCGYSVLLWWFTYDTLYVGTYLLSLEMSIYSFMCTSRFELNNVFTSLSEIYCFSVISTTFETDASSKSTNFVPHSSPSDVLPTTAVTPINDDADPFCLVMGNYNNNIIKKRHRVDLIE